MVQANLRIPKRNLKTLRRPRLLDQLHNNAHRKLSFVCAPAGYGKTTLLVDFAEDVDGVIFWYRITEQDSTLSAFYENIVYAIQAVIPDFGKDLAGLEQISGKTPRFLALDLINAIEQSVGEYSFLILDDYHVVSDCPEIVEFLDYFLEYLPDQLRVVIGSRSVYGIPTAALYIQEQLAVIGTTELAFTPHELQELCSQYYQINLTEQQTRRIIEESEGWIVAILLALRSESTTIEIPKILGAREHIYHYLANEVVSALPEYMKAFMFATSIVEEFSVPFANYLLEIENASQIIQELEELNLFLSDTDSGEEVIFRYHQLFAEFLHDHLGDSLADRRQGFHLRAASWYDQAGFVEKAAAHYFQAGEVERAAAVIDRSAQRYYVNGQIDLLRNWYAALGENGASYEDSPILLLSLGKSDIARGEYAKGAEMLAAAEEVLLARQDYGSYANLLIARGMIFRFTGKFEEALETADKAQELVDEYGLEKIYWDQAERLKGIVSYYLGNVDDAFTYLTNAAAAFREAIADHPDRDHIHDLMMTLADIGHFGIEQGRIFEAQKSFKEAVALTKKIPGNFIDMAIAFNNYAYLNFLLGEYALAWQNYAQGIEATRVHHLERYQVYIMNGQADVLREIEEFDEARTLYEKVLEFAERIEETYALVDAYSGLVEVETRTGFYNKALYYIRELARVTNSDLSDADNSARFGKVYLAMGQLEMARDSLTAADKAWGESPAPQQAVADGYFHIACVLHALGETHAAVEYLQKSFAMAAALGYDQFLVAAARNYRGFMDKAAVLWQSPQLESVLRRAGEERISKDQLEMPREEPRTVEAALQVSALGREVVRLNGAPIQNARWLSLGARAMFFFILDQQEVTKEQIALEFWPEFSPGKVNSNFHATLWRVRNALGGRHMIEFKGSLYRVNPSVNLHYDVAQFEALLKRLEDDLAETELRTLLRQCVELYQGDFLENIDMPWADRRRGELQNAYLQVLSRLAGIELTRHNFTDAAGYFDRLIEIEPYHDAFHKGRMACWVGIGNVNRARQHFQDYQDFLDKELGVTPDDEIFEYYDSL